MSNPTVIGTGTLPSYEQTFYSRCFIRLNVSSILLYNEFGFICTVESLSLIHKDWFVINITN